MSQEQQKPAEKATEYKSEESKSTKTPARSQPKSLQHWNDLVSGRIEEAMQQGAFDNLPGHGKPLNLRRNPYTPEEQQMAFNLLEDNNLTPGWIGDRQKLQNDIAALRSQMAQAVARQQKAWANASPHERSELQLERPYYLRRWQTSIDELNKRIKSLNLQQPFIHLEILILKLDEELARLGADWRIENAG
ncbi:MAG: DUF1992 domain-containing protein [Caldilineaceae bacterium]